MTLHRDVSEANKHEPKGAATAAKGTAYLSDGAGSGAWAKPVGNNVVTVNTEADFPTPSGGVITLAGNTNYVIGGDVTTANRFVASQGTTVSSIGLRSPVLAYTGGGTMFTAVNADFVVKELRIDCPSAQAFDCSETGGGGTKLFRCNSIQVDNCTKFGTFTDLQANLFENSNAANAADGIKLVGTNSLLTSIRQLVLLGTSPTFVGLDLTGSIQNNFEVVDFTPAGGAGSIGIKGDAGSANVQPDRIAVITRCSFGLVTTALSGITVDDIRYKFIANGKLGDTMPDALLSMVGNVTATVTPLNTPTLVAGTWVDQRKSHFTNTAAGRATYNGERPLTVPLDSSITVEPASGTNKIIRAYIAINGVVQLGSGKSIRVDSGNPLNLTLMWQANIAKDDYIEVFVENKTDSVNIVVKDAVLRVR